jgi:transposase
VDVDSELQRGTGLKILAYDGQGYWLCQTRFSQGKLQHWSTGADGVQRALLAHELAVLLMGGDPSRTHAAPRWRRVAASLPA